jgi:hypothetical protein
MPTVATIITVVPRDTAHNCVISPTWLLSPKLQALDGRVSKQGDRYLRSLFTTGALAVIRYAKIHGTQHRPWLTALLARRPTKVAAIARCAVLHTYGSVAAIHSKPNPPRKFGYMDNGPHKKDDSVQFVLISVAVLTRDFSKAVERFVKEFRSDPELKRRVDSRIGSLFFASLVDH